MNNTLESQRWFPYVAWLLVVSFAMFTANLAFSMQRELSEISQSTNRIEQALVDNKILPDDRVTQSDQSVDAVSDQTGE